MRGSNSTKLQGRWRTSSCWTRIRSIAVRTAPVEPGSAKTSVPPQIQASARDWIVEVPISFTDRIRGESKMSSRIVVEALVLVTAWGVRDRLLRFRR